MYLSWTASSLGVGTGQLLGAKSDYQLSVHTTHLDSRRAHFREILYWEIFTKLRRRISLVVKSGQKWQTLFMRASWQLYCIPVWEKNEKYGSFREVGETVDDPNIACCNVPSETQKNCFFRRVGRLHYLNVQLTETQLCSTTTWVLGVLCGVKETTLVWRPRPSERLWPSWGMKNQLDVTCYFISLIMRSTCFEH